MSSKEQRKLVLSLQREQKQKQKKQRKEEEKDERKKERAKRREMCGTVRNSAEQCAKHDLCRFGSWRTRGQSQPSRCWPKSEKDLQTEIKEQNKQKKTLNSEWNEAACEKWNTEWNAIKSGKWNVRNVRQGAKISAELLGLTPLPRQNIEEDAWKAWKKKMAETANTVGAQMHTEGGRAECFQLTAQAKETLLAWGALVLKFDKDKWQQEQQLNASDDAKKGGKKTVSPAKPKAKKRPHSASAPPSAKKPKREPKPEATPQKEQQCKRVSKAKKGTRRSRRKKSKSRAKSHQESKE
jgi:cell division septation protein DedD